MKILDEKQKNALGLINGVIENLDNNLKKYRTAIKNLLKEKENFIKIKDMIR